MTIDPHEHLIEALETAYPFLVSGTDPKQRLRYIAMLRPVLPHHFAADLAEGELPSDIAEAVQKYVERRQANRWTDRLTAVSNASERAEPVYRYLQSALDGLIEEFDEQLRELTLQIIANENAMTEALTAVDMNQEYRLSDIVRHAFDLICDRGGEMIFWTLPEGAEYRRALTELVGSLVDLDAGNDEDRESIRRLIAKGATR